MTDPNQPFRALDIANAVRGRRASLRRQCRNMTRLQGLAFVADVLEWQEDATQTLSVLELLTWPKFAQRKTAEGLLHSVGVRKMSVEVKQLTPRQRLALVARLREVSKGTEWIEQVTAA